MRDWLRRKVVAFLFPQIVEEYRVAVDPVSQLMGSEKIDFEEAVQRIVTRPH